MNASGTYQVLTTTSSEEHAERLARTVLDSHLAACVQVLGPMTSRYWWKGELETEREWLCVLKTSGGALEALVAAVQEAHTYDLPEITVTEIVGGSEPYLEWVRTEASGGGATGS